MRRKMFTFTQLAALAICCAVPFANQLRSEDTNRIGTKISNFSLKNQFGKEYSLQEIGDSEVVVVAFLGTECPLAKLYGPRLSQLSSQLKDKPVAFLGVMSNRQDAINEIAAYAQRHQIEFPILKDTGNAVADQFGAVRTPEVFVLDKQRVIRYRGRIDDQYGFRDSVGYQRPEPTRHDLQEAINEVLAGLPVTLAETKAIGCHIGRVREANETSEVTYSNQIARIFQKNCIECHRAGRIGPFEMNSYEEVAGWGEMIREVVDAGRMPPWHANPTHGEFLNDSRLSEQEKRLIATWVENGCPEGDPADLPAPQSFVEGWSIGQPDQVIYMSEDPVDVPAEGVIDYYHFLVDPGWTEDKWIMAAEAKPSSLETVHHILVFVQPPGSGGFGPGSGSGRRGRPDGQRSEANVQSDDRPNGTDERTGAGDRRERRGRFSGEGGRRGPSEGSSIGGGNLIAGYAPGANPLFASDSTTAMHVKAGSKLLFQLHYTPNGTPQKDRSYLGLVFADPEKVKYVARSESAINPFFSIPPGADNHQVTAESTFHADTTLVNFTPHMHTRGKSFRYDVTYPDGRQETLLDVPAYDFNWQTTYVLKEPKLMPKGTKLVCTAAWDNSEKNLSNPDPTVTVSWGEQTFEEMMIGFYVATYPKDQVPDLPSGGSFGAPPEPEDIFKALDQNGDGKLVQEEMPERMAQRFKLIDMNKDGGVTLDELTTIMKMFSGGPPGGRRQ
jgi:peroxiredoxin/mono/diheme cytochrome c family protein